MGCESEERKRRILGGDNQSSETGKVMDNNDEERVVN